MIVDRVLSHAHAGMIAVMHVKPQTAAALPSILRGLDSRGLRQSSLTELFPRDAERSPFDQPQRRLCCGIFRGLRYPDPLGISYYPEAARYFRLMRPDPDTGYGHRPGLHGTFQGVAVDIDERGLRGRPIGPKAAGSLP